MTDDIQTGAGMSPAELRETKDFSYLLRDNLLSIQAREKARHILDAEKLVGITGHDLENCPIMVYDPLPEAAPELMPGLLPQRGTAAIVGETNTGKSLIALEICSSLLTGEPLWGQIQPTRTIKRVTYILGEHTISTIQGLYHRTGLPHAGDFRLIGPEHLHPYKALVVAGVAQQIAIDRLAKWTEGSDLIVFDPLAGFIQGLGAEQDNASMRTLIDSMSYIAEANDSACLILSHMGKPRMDESGATLQRKIYAMRGASSQEDALTHVFYLTKTLSVKRQGSAQEFDLEVRKFKGNPTNDAFKLVRDPKSMRNTLKGTDKSVTMPTLADKQVLMEKAASIQAEFPKYDDATVIKVLAAAEKLPVDTVKRWLGMVPEKH